MKLTVICQEDGYPEPLIYTINADPNDKADVVSKICLERAADLGFENLRDIEVLFAFAGDISPVADWRE
jgi:hypothetical protein